MTSVTVTYNTFLKSTTQTHKGSYKSIQKHLIAALKQLISFRARKSKRQRQGPANVRQGPVGGRMDGPVLCGHAMDGMALRDLRTWPPAVNLQVTSGN